MFCSFRSRCTTSTSIMSEKPVTSWVIMVCTMLGLSLQFLSSINSLRSFPLQYSIMMQYLESVLIAFFIFVTNKLSTRSWFQISVTTRDSALSFFMFLRSHTLHANNTALPQLYIQWVIVVISPFCSSLVAGCGGISYARYTLPNYPCPRILSISMR